MIRVQCLCLAALLVVSRGEDHPEIDEYRFSWSEDGTGFELNLFSRKNLLKTIPGKPFQNFTAVSSSSMVGGQKYLPMMLEEAAGGRCDACVMLTRALWSTTTRLVAEKGALKNGQTPEDKKILSLNMEDPGVQLEYTRLCESEQFRHKAPHVIKGCVEFMNFHAQAIVEKISNMMLDSMYNYPKLPHAVCTDLLNVCPAIPDPPVSSDCGKCATVVNELHLRLRSDARTGMPLASDPMALSKRKKAVAEYMSRSHVYSRLQTLCEDVAMDMMLSQDHAGTVQEYCESLTEGYEDELVKEFTDQQGKASWRDPIQGICGDEIEACTRLELSELEPRLAQRWTAGGTSPPEQTVQVHAAAFEMSTMRGTKVVGSEQQSTKLRVTSGARGDDTEDDMEAELHSRLDELERAELLESREMAECMRRLYESDKVLLRVFRFERNKSNKELAARLKLIATPRAAPSKEL